MASSTATDAKLKRTAFICAGVAGFMVMAAFASVPLYDLFCRMTGFGGTPMVRTVHSDRISERSMAVRFDANVSPGLGWRFEAEKATVDVRVGQTVTVNYRITNQSDKATTGIASYNVQPAQAGAYFVKVQCFCFTEHRLGPGETMEAPVVFYVDPEIEQNAELKGLKSITLSYTYFPAKVPPVVTGSNQTGAGPDLPLLGGDKPRL
jgi:cytochrome c oxidase assembly protein subunit 11